MSALTANSTIYYAGDGSINSQDTPSQQVSITESASSSTNNNIAAPQSSSTSTLNAIQTPESEIAISDKESQTIMDALQLINDLDLFLATAPVNWHENQVIRRYFLNKEEGFVSCVYWNNLYFITGTDIVRCIAYKMAHIGRQIVDRKKFEEGIFSDLRALKCGTHAVLENSRSSFLKFLHRNQCLRTQKKQKVFFWFSVPHSKLFSDVLERDLKRELSNLPATTKATSPIFKSFQFDQSQPLMEQLSAHFSKFLGKNVDHFLLKSNNLMQASTDNVTNVCKQNISMNNNSNSITNLDTNINTVNNIGHGDTRGGNVHTTGQSPIDMTKHSNNSHISDDFPLDFLDSSNHFLNENYITSISPVDGGLRANSQFFLDRQTYVEDPLFSSKTSQFQIHQQLHMPQQQNQQHPQQHYQHQHQHQHSQQHGLLSSQLQEHFDGFLLNSNQSLLSASYSQPQNLSMNQQLFLLSDFPSAVEPTHTLSESQIPRQATPLSSNLSQLVPISIQHPHILASPSTILMNADNQLSIDQMLVPSNDQSTQPIQEHYTHSRDPSSPINLSTTATATTSAYVNLPSATLLPVSFPVSSSASFKLVSRPEESNISDNSQVDSTARPQEESDTLGINPILTDKAVNTESVKTEQGAKIKTQLLDTKPSINNNMQQSSQQQDYMMLMPSYSNNVNRMNLGIIGGQIFTPGSIGVEYSFENAALSAGIGISPVIGFNNGLLSAIQYQAPKVSEVKELSSSLANEIEKKSDYGDDSKAESAEGGIVIENDHEENELNGNNSGIDSHEIISDDPSNPKIDNDNVVNGDDIDPGTSLLHKGPNKMKGILLKEKQSKVTKKKNVKLTTRTKFLNPTLRHLHLDDVFDGKA